jgi:hypothetical protein
VSAPQTPHRCFRTGLPHDSEARVEVYVTIDDKRAFLVPEGGALPDGSLAVRDLDGAERVSPKPR